MRLVGYHSLEDIIAAAGSTHLGGEEFVNRNVDFCLQDLAGNHRVIRLLRTQCERAKRTISSSTQATIESDSLVGGIDYSRSLSRARFDKSELEILA